MSSTSTSSSMHSKMKSVLVNHLERKVVFQIPQEKDISDVKFLIMKFQKKFNLKSNMQVIFQRFDAEWEQLVDLEEDDLIDDKDKLTAIITSFGKVSI